MRDRRLVLVLVSVGLLGCGKVLEAEKGACTDGLSNVGMPCTADADCPCAECISVSAESKVCSASCQLPEDCIAGWRCGSLDPNASDKYIPVCLCDASTEVCDGVDNDCDGKIDTDAPGLPAAYADSDSDGFGDPAAIVHACQPPAGYVENSADCDDGDSASHPGADERCNGKDDNCDGMTPANEADADGDGLAACGGDCNDGSATVFPMAAERCNGADDDCDGMTDEGLGLGTACDGADTDSCKEGTLVCGAGGSVVCNDASSNNVELCNGVDDDCDGVVPGNEADMDGDGYRLCAGDCNDANPSIHPGAAEICDGVDQNCSGVADEGLRGTVWRDADGDGYGDPNVAMGNACPQAGWVSNASDCYDANGNAHPGQQGYFATHRGDGSYDYNCANGNELESGAATQCDARSADGCYVTPQVGWEWNVPGCGQQGQWNAYGCYSGIDELTGQPYCATGGSAPATQRCH